MAAQKPDQVVSDDEDDFDFDEEYFDRTYRPLSNLPTPPLSSKNSSASHSPQPSFADGEALDPSLLGPAIHLVNLIPPPASLATPSVPLVQAMLTRANLPLDTVALAVCILDSLDSRFAMSWRLTCPLAAHERVSSGNKRHTVGPGPLMGLGQQPHIDSVYPELIILSALIIAVKFTADLHEPTQHYATLWGRSLWTCDQINATERCIMESLGYRILPLCEREVIAGALADMERAARPQRAALSELSRVPQRRKHLGTGQSDNAPHLRSMSSGVAVTGLGLQLTPIETPRSTNSPCSPTSYLSEDIRTAFGSPTMTLSPDALCLPDGGKRKGFSAATEIIG